MKKIIVLFLSLLIVQASVYADNDKSITFAQLPSSAQQFINSYFPKVSIALIKMENDIFDKSYEVIFTNGDKVDFDRKGVWKELDCKYSEVPSDVIPAQIRSYVQKNYPNLKIVSIEKEDRRNYEVKLSNGLDLTFDSKYNLIDIDN